MKNLQNLTKNEMTIINGGHDGDAYNWGKACGKALQIVGALALFFIPKS